MGSNGGPSKLRRLHAVLVLAWCAETTYGEWDELVPDMNQCAVTALIVQDRFGGDLLRAPTGRGDSHYWNRLPDGREVDFTRGQFDYLGDWPLRNRAEVRERSYVLESPRAIEFNTAARYALLKRRVEVILQLLFPRWQDNHTK